MTAFLPGDGIKKRQAIFNTTGVFMSFDALIKVVSSDDELPPDRSKSSSYVRMRGSSNTGADKKVDQLGL